VITTLLAQSLLLGLSIAPRVPWVKTDVTGLSPEGLVHQEVLRIDPDFGGDHHDIVVDSWRLADQPDALSEVRMWWLHSEENDERSPFGKGVRRYIELDYVRKGPRRFGVVLRGERKEWGFDVVLQEGKTIALADITNEQGVAVSQCQASSAKLLVRRVMGLPAGIKGLEVSCRDAAGNEHVGTLTELKTKRRRK